jgi:RND family efflux transporter MFP subunit
MEIKRNIRGIIILMIMALAGLTACSGGPETTELVRPDVTGVQLMNAAPSEVSEFYEATGTVRSGTVSVISSRVMGAVVSVNVDEGETVRKGQVLLRIDDREMRAKVRAAEEGYNEAMKALNSARKQKELADTTYARFQRLYDEKALSQQELDNVRTKKEVAGYEYERVNAMVERAKAGLHEARIYLGYAEVASPINGIVSSKKVDAGSMANPGMPLLVVEDGASYRIDTNVDERYLGTFREGMDVRVHVASLDKDMTGKVNEVVPSVDPATRTFLVKVNISDPALRTGQYGKVSFPVGTRSALMVPTNAVVQKGQLTGVYVVDGDGIITYRLVRAGRPYEGNVEVLSGLRADERVVVGGLENVRDGGRIKDIS